MDHAEVQPSTVALESRSKLRVLVFNRSYYPDVEATGQLLTELCTDLTAHCVVHVVAGQPNFVALERGGLLQEDSHRDVAITRVRNLKFSKKSLVGRIVGLLTYLVLAFWVGLRSRRPDVILVETDPPLLPLLGVILGRWHRCRSICYLQDLYPEVGLALGKLRPGLMTRLLYWATQVGLRGSDHIIVLGEDMRAKVVGRGITAKKTTVVPNWADTNLIYPRPRTTDPWDRATPTMNGSNGIIAETCQDDALVVMYSGNLGLSQNLDQLLEVARDLRHLPIRFVVVGEGAAKAQLLARATAWNLANVRFFSYQAKEKLGESLSAADVHFIPLRRGLAGAIVPSKLYGILAAGVPFIAAVEHSSEIARVATQTGAGLVIPPDSASDLAASLRWCLDNRALLPAMGRRGRRAAELLFSRPVCVRQIDQVIAKVAAKR
jgi:glycosyltransferase involved in cell wall biosynthesis